MTAALVKHLRDGAFLGRYGVSSVSVEDETHYELNDPDWSGGGCYSGDGPELAEILWNANMPELAWNVLKRHLWMGGQLLYFPQEHYCDIPGVPHNKRANIIAGLAGVHALLFGMAGINLNPDGSISVNPKPLAEGWVSIRGYKCGDKVIDIEINAGKATVNGL
jgi:hypothetical protein